MFNSPLHYNEPLFRPPSEAHSLILQVTFGCSWNKCAFCDMYASKKFKLKEDSIVFEEIKKSSIYFKNVRKIFLADGNAMALPTKKLLKILHYINKYFPNKPRVSAYALPQDIIRKSNSELALLRENGLKLLYVGIESGDDNLLKLINKNESSSSTIEGLIKAQESGINNSVMIITGLGGHNYSEQHAINSAKIINKIQPYYLSTLVLSFPLGVEHYTKKFKGKFKEQTTIELLKEMKVFINNTNLNATIYRSDHASNHLSLKGILSKDKTKILTTLDNVINNPDYFPLRKEWQRGL